MTLGRDWSAASTDPYDLDPASRLATPLNTYIQQQFRVGLTPLGEVSPEVPELGAGLGEQIGGAVISPQSKAKDWETMVKLDGNTASAQGSGVLLDTGVLRYSLRFTTIDQESGTLVVTIGSDGRPQTTIEP